MNRNADLAEYLELKKGRAYIDWILYRHKKKKITFLRIYLAAKSPEAFKKFFYA